MTLKQLIRQSGFTQTEIAKILGVHKSTVTRILNGQITLSLPMALKLSRLLGVSVEELLELFPDQDTVPAQR